MSETGNWSLIDTKYTRSEIGRRRIPSGSCICRRTASRIGTCTMTTNSCLVIKQDQSRDQKVTLQAARQFVLPDCIRQAQTPCSASSHENSTCTLSPPVIPSQCQHHRHRLPTQIACSIQRLLTIISVVLRHCRTKIATSDPQQLVMFFCSCGRCFLSEHALGRHQEDRIKNNPSSKCKTVTSNNQNSDVGQIPLSPKSAAVS